MCRRLRWVGSTSGPEFVENDGPSMQSVLISTKATTKRYCLRTSERKAAHPHFRCVVSILGSLLGDCFSWGEDFLHMAQIGRCEVYLQSRCPRAYNTTATTDDMPPERSTSKAGLSLVSNVHRHRVLTKGVTSVRCL